MTGVELLELLMHERKCPPALVITARMDETIAARLAKLGIAIMNKPVPEEALLAFVESIGSMGSE